MSYVLTHDDLVEKLRQQMGYLERSAKLFDQGHEDEAFRLAAVIRVLVHDTASSHSVLGQLGVKEKLAYVDTSEPIHPLNRWPTMGLVSAKVELIPGGAKGSYDAPLGDDAKSAKRAGNRSRKGGKRKKGRRKAVDADENVLYLRGALNLPAGEPMPPPDVPPYRRQKPFSEWWNEPVTKDSRGALFARRDYVRAGANKEGGSHVDPSLEAEWAQLTREDTLNVLITTERMTLAIDTPGGSGQGTPVQMGNPAPPSIRQIAYELEQTVREQLADLL